MIDLSQFETVTGLAVLLIIIMQFIKGSVGSKAAVPWVSVGLGIVLMLLFNWATGNIHTSSQWVSYALGGFLAGLYATGGYEATLDKVKGVFVSADTTGDGTGAGATPTASASPPSAPGT